MPGPSNPVNIDVSARQWLCILLVHMATKSGRYANACSKGGAYGPCISLKCYHNCNRFLECYYHKHTNLNASICV